MERGKILEVASAARHRSPLYGRTAIWSGGPIPAPLVFSRASVFAEERAAPVSAALGVAPDELRHAGHEWVVSGPLVSDTEYTVHPWAHQGTRHVTAGNGVEHRFSTFARTITARDGSPVQEERMTVVHSSGGQPVASVGAPPIPVPVPVPGPVSASSLGSAPVGGSDRPGSGRWLAARAGELVADIDLGQVSRTDIVRFAGAIGDFTAIHHDVERARGAGLTDVIAMGMLPAALMLAPAEEELGPHAVRACSIRFRSVVYPGQPLALTVRAEEPSVEGQVTFSLCMTAASATALTCRLVADRLSALEWRSRVA